MGRLVDYHGAGQIIPVSQQTLRRFVSHQKIPFVKIGKRVFFDVDDLHAWIAARKMGPVGGRS